MHARPPSRADGSDLIVLSASGKLLFATKRAAALLGFYFPECRGHEPWLQRVAIWIAQSIPGSHHAKGWVSPPVGSVRNGRRLQVRLVETRLERILLLDEEPIPLDALERGASALRVLGMTEREAEVLYWVAEGKSNADVGVILQIALRTVKKHLEHIFAKLGVENRTCAAARANEALRGRAISRGARPEAHALSAFMENEPLLV